MSALPIDRLVVASVLLGLGACIAPSQSWNEGADTRVTPQRPTFSSNTATAVAGTAEVEAGMALDPGTSFDTPTTFKYGVRPGSEAYVGFSPYRSAELPGDDGEGFGDVVLGWRQRIADQEGTRPSLAWGAGLKVPTADEQEGLGSGELDGFGTFAASFSEEDFTGTIFGQLALLGETSGSGVDHQESIAVAVDRPLEGGAGVFAELAFSMTPERDQESLFTTLGGTWSPTPGLVLDASVLIGLSEDAPDFAVMIGFTRSLGRLLGWAIRTSPGA